MSHMVHKMKNDRNVSHYVSNDMKYSYWLVQEKHLIRYWKITGIDDGIIHECKYTETDSYQVTEMFINNREYLLKRLLQE